MNKELYKDKNYLLIDKNMRKTRKDSFLFVIRTHEQVNSGLPHIAINIDKTISAIKKTKCIRSF